METIAPIVREYVTVPLWQDDWSVFAKSMVDPTSFTWEHGKTPFSHILFSVLAVIFYVGFTFFLQFVMRFREKPLSGPLFTCFLVFHNAVLSLGSLAMFVGISYEVYRHVTEVYRVSTPDELLNALVCDPKNELLQNENSGFAFWSYLYFLSKFYEFIDSWVLALKKKELTFLQMFHHAIIVLLCWSWLEAQWPLHWFGAWANTLVHTFMYYYFALSAVGKDVWWKKYLTSGQLLQFSCVFVLIMVWISLSLKDLTFQSDFPFVHFSAQVCSGGLWSVVFSQGTNIIFLFLFGNLFMDLYVRGKKSKKQKRE